MSFNMGITPEKSKQIARKILENSNTVFIKFVNDSDSSLCNEKLTLFYPDECSELATNEFLELRKKAIHCSGGGEK